jgi:PRTRC genetic system protein B
MQNITNLFKEVYQPSNALLFFKSQRQEKVYVELYDIGHDGYPLNGRPLTIEEGADLAALLRYSEESNTGFLKPDGVLPENVLYTTDGAKAYAIWYTPAQERELHFIDDLEIRDGKMQVPSMIWKANKKELYVYALNQNQRPVSGTMLYHAPFFNLHNDGKVCMGTVDITFSPSCSLQKFMKLWENYFFDSFFSHAISDRRCIKGNLSNLLKELIATGNPFPVEQLIKTSKKLKDILL